jgi:hypothetical protein
MAMPAWPAGIPFAPDRDSWSEQPERNVITFKPEVGAPKERRRSTAVGSIANASIVLPTVDVDVFWAFYRDTLFDGIAPFTLAHPRTGLPCVWKFEGEAPTETPFGALNWTLSFQLRRLP